MPLMKMERYTLQQRIEIVKIQYKNAWKWTWISQKNHYSISDEAPFHLGGYVNKQNCRIWGSENRKMVIENLLHPQRVTTWYGFWAAGIIEPYFFKNEAGVAVWVNGLRYWTMINEFLWPELKDIDVVDVYLQQDDATCHTSCKTICLSCGKFPGSVISRNGDYDWPPRWCDLTPLDFFLWGYVKDKVYADAP